MLDFLVLQTDCWRLVGKQLVYRLLSYTKINWSSPAGHSQGPGSDMGTSALSLTQVTDKPHLQDAPQTLQSERDWLQPPITLLLTVFQALVMLIKSSPIVTGSFLSICFLLPSATQKGLVATLLESADFSSPLSACLPD